MITKIGVVAGEILTLLDFNKEPVSVKELEFILDESRDMILMSVGWLAREGFVFLERKDHDYYLSLLSSHLSSPSPINDAEAEEDVPLGDKYLKPMIES